MNDKRKEYNLQSQEKSKTILKVIGFLSLLGGLTLIIIALVNIITTISTGGGMPQLFWLLPLGILLLGIGGMSLLMAYHSKMIRYATREAAPIVKDMANYVIDGTKETRDNKPKRACLKCGAIDDLDQKFVETAVLLKMIMINSLVFKIYGLLLNKYGPQKWWPADSKYEMMAGAILTQNTTWKNVEAVMPLLKPYLEPTVLLSLEDERLENIIKPSGFFKQKTKYLKNLFQYFLDNSFDELSNKDTVTFRKELLQIKGVGKETADSILLYAFNRAIFVIDTYTKRMLKKVGVNHLTTYDQYQEYMGNNLPKDFLIYNEYHALIVRYNKEPKRNYIDPLASFM